MEELDLVKKMAQNLEKVFDSELNSSEKKFYENVDKNLLITFACIGKNQINFRSLIEKSATSKAILDFEFTKDIVDLCIDKNLIAVCQTISKRREFHITSTGLFFYYSQEEMDMKDFFLAFDKYKLPGLDLKLNIKEKILCLFLIIVGADSFENAFHPSEHNLNKCFDFMQKIESELISTGIDLGNKITWGSGKNINFRKFITNNKDLNKTGIYVYIKSKDLYYLDMSSRSNIDYLINLIIEQDSAVEKIKIKRLLYNIIWEYSSKALLEIGQIMPDLNKILINELRN